MNAFTSRISYRCNNHDVVTIEHAGFSSVKDATSWMLEKVGYLVLHWGEIDENGLEIHAEVLGTHHNGSECEFPFFSDVYEFRCGC